jgi:hypothetical protein
MRAGPLSNQKVIELLNGYYVPVYVVNEDYATKGPAPAEEKRALKRVFSEGHSKKISVGSVHVYLLDPQGSLIDSMHVAQAAKTTNFIAMLEKTAASLQLAAGKPVAPVRKQSQPPACGADCLVVHLTARSLDGKGVWTDFPVENWVVLDRAEQRTFLPQFETLRPGQSWTVPKATAEKLLTHFYPATENNDPRKNKFQKQTMRATVESVDDRLIRLAIAGEMKMEHWFYHKADGKEVEADFVGFAEVNRESQRLEGLTLVTRKAQYNGGKFGVALSHAH